MARSEYGKNGTSGDGDTVTNTTDLAANDSVTVAASRVVPGYFSRIFGFSGITVRAGNRYHQPWSVVRDWVRAKG